MVVSNNYLPNHIFLDGLWLFSRRLFDHRWGRCIGLHFCLYLLLFYHRSLGSLHFFYLRHWLLDDVYFRFVYLWLFALDSRRCFLWKYLRFDHERRIQIRYPLSNTHLFASDGEVQHFPNIIILIPIATKSIPINTIHSKMIKNHESLSFNRHPIIIHTIFQILNFLPKGSQNLLMIEFRLLASKNMQSLKEVLDLIDILKDRIPSRIHLILLQFQLTLIVVTVMIAQFNQNRPIDLLQLLLVLLACELLHLLRINNWLLTVVLQQLNIFLLIIIIFIVAPDSKEIISTEIDAMLC